MEEVYSGFIVVRLAALAPALADANLGDLRTLAQKHGFGELIGVMDGYPGCRTNRLVSALSPKETVELEDKAERRGFKPRRSLASYWRLDARDIGDPDRLVDLLNQLDVVDLAYREVRGRNPEPPPQPGNPFARHQFHLDPAPIGIDAHFAHAAPHGSGESVAFVDLEQGWLFSHEDLPDIQVLPGVPRDVNPSSRHHGTAVLGIVVGRDNNLGIVGIAPNPRSVSVTSHFRTALGGDHVVDAIEAVLPHLLEGDVLLVEWQDGFERPPDANPAIRDAIEMACGLGVIVVEPAGNGNFDLDTIATLNRNAPATFEDSGAIMAGACHSSLDLTRAAHDRWVHPTFPAGSNFGSRVDCHSFGEKVITAGPPLFPGERVGTGTRPTNQYRRDFGGTSAAAAIVAGAAVVLQGMHKAVKNRPLSPAEMRSALSTHGTPQGAGRAGSIGVMPDLKKAALALGL